MRTRRWPSAIHAIDEADVLVLVTPIYRATYSGLLKVLLDQLPTAALVGKACVLAATAGGPLHFLSLDTSMRALVASLDGWSVPTVVYVHRCRLRRRQPARVRVCSSRWAGRSTRPAGSWGAQT